MNGARALGVMVSVLALVGCDYVNGATVRNATGRTIGVLHASDTNDRTQMPMGSRWSWPWRWSVPIANGDGATLMYDVFHPWIVEIDFGDCRAWYRVPEDEMSASNLSQTNVQLEPDRLLYATEFDGEVHAVDIEPVRDQQPPGFPVRAFEQTCAAPERLSVHS